jgi:hypothetical protein
MAVLFVLEVLPLKQAEPLPGPPDRDVALAKLPCGCDGEGRSIRSDALSTLR